MRTIYFSEFTYILHRYRGNIIISSEDFHKLENNEITINDICSKYKVDYDGYSTPYYEDSQFDEYVYDGYNKDEDINEIKGKKL